MDQHGFERHHRFLWNVIIEFVVADLSKQLAAYRIGVLQQTHRRRVIVNRTHPDRAVAQEQLPSCECGAIRRASMPQVLGEHEDITWFSAHLYLSVKLLAHILVIRIVRLLVTARNHFRIAAIRL